MSFKDKQIVLFNGETNERDKGKAVYELEKNEIYTVLTAEKGYVNTGKVKQILGPHVFIDEFGVEFVISPI